MGEIRYWQGFVRPASSSFKDINCEFLKIKLRTHGKEMVRKGTGTF
jgi:hypothetical protein